MNESIASLANVANRGGGMATSSRGLLKECTTSSLISHATKLGKASTVSYMPGSARLALFRVHVRKLPGAEYDGLSSDLALAGYNWGVCSSQILLDTDRIQSGMIYTSVVLL